MTYLHLQNSTWNPKKDLKKIEYPLDVAIKMCSIRGFTTPQITGVYPMNIWLISSVCYDATI